ncbi:hypothetical protein WA026_004532 [Henosepilachna vigintioctopunctata]|uniref:Uncharacterized protein n=1 Tax=Henosepilachna vigintioctopunctata TaxID=420089 RepID=A0AAW1V3L5_9CUCU
MQSTTNARKEEYERVVLPPPLPKRCEQSSRRSRNKEVQSNQCLPAEWSIVLSGKNNSSFNSDLEMKIRFPSSRQNVSLPPHLPSESEENRENHQQYEKKSRFPRIDNKYLNYNTNKDYYGGSNGRVQNLPEINFNRETSNQRMSGSVASLRAMEITDIRPRQTKTSMRRYNMTRPKLHPLFESNIYDFNIDRQYPDILRRIPHFLAVNGNSLSSERKHHVPGMNRKEIPKHNCTPH